jgi:cobalt-zinc-cadmium efflux system protein
VAGGVIYYTGWMQIDPLLSLFVALLILKSTLGVLHESYHFLMGGVPEQIDYLKVGADLSNWMASARCTTCTCGTCRPASRR